MAHHAELIAVIKIRGRFVHYENPGLLRQRPSDQAKLALPAGNFRVAAFRKMADVQKLQHLRRDFTLVRSGIAQRLDLRIRAINTVSNIE